jgi:hypothetical protein
VPFQKADGDRQVSVKGSTMLLRHCLSKCLDLGRGILRFQTAKDLVTGDDRELKALVKAQVFLSLSLCGEVPALDDFGQRIGIEKRRPSGHSG